MNNKDKWTYKNEWAEENGIDPRDELERFVFGNFPFITEKNKKKIFKNYRLSGRDEVDKIMEFVQTNHPYEVLKQCFGAGRLHILAERECEISPDEGYSDHQIIEELLDYLGFKKEVKPDGLTQILKELEPRLNEAMGNTNLEPTYIDGFLADMHRKMEDLMIKLFLFHSGTLRDKLVESDDDERYVELCTLCEDYQEKNKQLGHYVLYLHKLMGIFEYDEAPLKAHQIGELGLFCVFRNLTLKNPDEGFWGLNKSNAEKSIEMFNDTQNEWTELWSRVVDAWDSKQPFPKYDMFQRMVVFFQDFLNVLVKDEIYPRVIVMQYHKVDMYGSHTIHAIDDAGKAASFVYKEFNPFTEYYYQARTNPISIDPILVVKGELEDWAIEPADNNTED